MQLQPFFCVVSAHRWGRRGGRTCWQTEEETEDSTARPHQSEWSIWPANITTDVQVKANMLNVKGCEKSEVLMFSHWRRLPWWRYLDTTRQCPLSCGASVRKFAVHHGTTRSAYGMSRREEWRLHWWETHWQSRTCSGSKSELVKMKWFYSSRRICLTLYASLAYILYIYTVRCLSVKIYFFFY